MTKSYRRGVGIVLINVRGKNAGRVFVAQRIDTKESAWQMPQGGIDDGETPREAALRELHEEIGTNKARIIGVTPKWLTYDLPAALRRKVWNGKYRGQKQKWFLMLFTGVDSDINIATPHPEFSSWKWLPFADLPRVIVGFKREIYKQVVAAFRAKVVGLAKPAKPNKTETARSAAPPTRKKAEPKKAKAKPAVKKAVKKPVKRVAKKVAKKPVKKSVKKPALKKKAAKRAAPKNKLKKTQKKNAKKKAAPKRHTTRRGR